MLQAWKGLLGSKKFWYVVVGSGLVAGMTQLHVPVDVINIVAGFFGLGVIGQGMSDWGKGAVKQP